MPVFRNISFSHAFCVFRWDRRHRSNTAMPYVASPLLTFHGGAHNAGLADEDAPAAPGQQDCPFRVRDRGHARRTSGQLPRARRLLVIPGGLPAARLQRAATLNPRTGISRVRNSPRAGIPEPTTLRTNLN
jgi:hypothetical protein